MILLGLTGNIACGKSTVARMLAMRGAIVLDADQLVRELYAEPAFATQVAQLFPDVPVLDADGGIDRAQLGRRVFADAAALGRLEALVHPAVAALRAGKLKAISATSPLPPAVVLEAVKLVESGQADDCDVVWCVTCKPQVQLRRLLDERGLSEGEARKRLAAQPSLETKRARLEYKRVPFVVLDNSGTLQELEARVSAQWQEILGEKAG